MTKTISPKASPPIRSVTLAGSGQAPTEVQRTNSNPELRDMRQVGPANILWIDMIIDVYSFSY